MYCPVGQPGDHRLPSLPAFLTHCENSTVHENKRMFMFVIFMFMIFMLKKFMFIMFTFMVFMYSMLIEFILFS
jgi:hypothetical protein